MYKVKARLKHDGNVYEAGDEIENIDEEDAEYLVENGVLEKIEEEVEVDVKPLSEMTKDELIKKAEEEDIDVKASGLKADIKETLGEEL